MGYPAWTTAPGMGTVLKLNGEVDFVRIPEVNATRLGVKTISVWLKLSDFLKNDSSIYGAGRRALGYACQDSYVAFVKHLLGAQGWVDDGYQNYGTTGTNGTCDKDHVVAGVGSVKLGEWQHWVFTHNVSSPNGPTAAITLNAYKNGVLQTGTLGSLTYPYTAANGMELNQCGMTAIGTQQDIAQLGYFRYFSGMMRDFRIYNRILTPGEISTLAAESRPISSDASAPTAPIGVSAVAGNPFHIDVSWTASTDNTGVVGYIVYRASGPSCSSYTPIATVEGATTYKDRSNDTGLGLYTVNLTSGNSYCYKVAAYDASYTYGNIVTNLSALSSATSATTVTRPSGTYNLTIIKSGTPLSYYVQSHPTGISCGPGCTIQTYAFNRGSLVELTPFPYGAGESMITPPSFTGWTGDCSGTGACVIYMDFDKSATANYGISLPPTTYTLTVAKSGTGAGTISGGSISCGAACTQSSISSGTSITLTASPSSGSTFTGWSVGGCSGTGSCTVSITAGTTITATFNTTSLVNGSCSTTLNSCAVGAFSDSADTATNYLWGCAGTNGGTTASCSLPIPFSPDTTLPTISITTPANSSTVSGSAVSLSATASDNIGVAGLQFKLDGANLGSELIITPYSGVWNTAGVPNGTHTLTATARDSAGNRATSTIAVIVNNIVAPTPDITPPSIPGGLTATAISSSQVNLSWNASTDPAVAGAVTSGVTSYRIYRGGTLLITVTGTAYSNTGLSASTLYGYTVSAFDGAGNSSIESLSVSTTTQAPPALANNPPVPSNGLPSSALAAGTAQTAISLATDKAATCKYSTLANTAYGSMAGSFTITGSITHSTIVANLVNGTTYTYYIRCDSAGSAATGDYIISFSVSSPPPATPPSGGTTGGGGSSSGGNTGTGSAAGSTGSQRATPTPPATATSTFANLRPSIGTFTPTVPQIPPIASFTNFIHEQKELLTKIDQTLVKRLSGQILLQVEDHGQAWYVEPLARKRFYLADGNAAYGALCRFGLGITDKDLAKIPVGVETRFMDTDTDNDGLADKLEEGLGADINNPDTDGDGFKDGAEIAGGFNPLGAGKLVYDSKLLNRLRGRIVLQVEKRGQAWYLNPADGRRYYLKDGPAAYEIMRYLSLGITNGNIRKIGMGD